MGVLGAEFGQDAEDQKRKSGAVKSTIEGFAIGANQNLARLTSNFVQRILYHEHVY